MEGQVLVTHRANRSLVALGMRHLGYSPVRLTEDMPCCSFSAIPLLACPFAERVRQHPRRGSTAHGCTFLVLICAMIALSLSASIVAGSSSFASCSVHVFAIWLIRTQ